MSLRPLFLHRSLFHFNRKFVRIAPLFSRHSLFYSTGPGEEEREKGSSKEENLEEQSAAPGESPEQASADTEPETEKKIDKEKEFNEVKDSYLRCIAEMENIRIHARQQINETTEKAFLRFANEILPIADILNESLSKVPENLRNSKDDPQLSNLCTGVAMIRTELSKTLKRHGIEEYTDVDVAFNPVLHEVVRQSEVSGKVPGTIAEVIKPGYMYKNRVLRPASVIIVEETQQ